MQHLIWFDCSYFTHHQFEKISQDVLFVSPDVTQFLKLAEGSNNLTTIEIIMMISFMQMITATCIVYIVVQFYPFLVLILFWGMSMYDNEFETKEIKFEPRIKMTHKII